MKVGILTFHRAYNYGAVLQCYALQEILIGLGHEVSVIDYKQPWIEDYYKPFSLRVLNYYRHGLLEKIKYFLRYFKRVKTTNIRKKIFNDFIVNYLRLTKPCSQDIPFDYDVYVIGSDQLWGLQCLGGKKDKVYMGSFAHKRGAKIVGYAISTNEVSIQTLLNDGLELDVKNFSAISLREKTIIDIVDKYLDYPIELCVDPTLLTSKSTWDSMTNNSKWEKYNYVLIYQIRHFNDSNKFIKKQADLIAKDISHSLGEVVEVIDINKLNPSVDEFVSLFKYAKCVVTSSFHATVFSLIFNTPFYSVVLNDGKDGRYVNLLTKVGAVDRLLSLGEFKSYSDYDFKEINKKLPIFRESSYAFLCKYVN